MLVGRNFRVISGFYCFGLVFLKVGNVGSVVFMGGCNEIIMGVGGVRRFLVVFSL